MANHQLVRGLLNPGAPGVRSETVLMSDSFMTGRRPVRTIARMPATSPVRADAIGITVDDMHASLRFYRRCGFDVPADAGPDSPHVEIPLAGGSRLMLDAVAVTRSLHPDWTPPPGSSRIAIAVECTACRRQPPR